MGGESFGPPAPTPARVGLATFVQTDLNVDLLALEPVDHHQA